MRKLAALALASFVLSIGAQAVAAPDDYYTNRDGDQVHRPMHARHAPRGATAKCRDGSWSFSEHARGTCSHHGGVAVWL
jgi:hypothetical protein